MQTMRSNLKSLSIFPVPSTTDARGSSAMETGKPVSSRMRLSRFLSSAPPPVNTMPRSLISADSFAVVDGYGTRHAFDKVAAFDFHGQRLFQRVSGANLHFNLFGSALADEQVVFALEVLHDRFVHLVARHTNGT